MMDSDIILFIKICGMALPTIMAFTGIIYALLDYRLSKKYVSKENLDVTLQKYITLDQMTSEIESLESGLEKAMERFTDKIEDMLRESLNNFRVDLHTLQHRIDKVWDRLKN